MRRQCCPHATSTSDVWCLKTRYVVWLNWISGPNATEISLLVHTLCVCGSRRNYCDHSHHMLPSPLPFPSDDGSKQTVQRLKLGAMAGLIVPCQWDTATISLLLLPLDCPFSSMQNIFQIYPLICVLPFPLLSFLLHNRLTLQVRWHWQVLLVKEGKMEEEEDEVDTKGERWASNT